MLLFIKIIVKSIVSSVCVCVCVCIRLLDYLISLEDDSTSICWELFFFFFLSNVFDSSLSSVLVLLARSESLGEALLNFL